MVSDFLPAPNVETQSLNSTTTQVMEQFLQLQFASDMTTLLSTEHLTEVITVSPEQIMPMPHMSPWMMGTYNWRGEILWLVDVGCLIGLTPLYQQVIPTYTAAVLQFPPPANAFNSDPGIQIVGLVFNEVGNIERCDPNLIETSSISGSNPELEKFLRGYWVKCETEIMAVLNPDILWQKISQP